MCRIIGFPVLIACFMLLRLLCIVFTNVLLTGILFTLLTFLFRNSILVPLIERVVKPINRKFSIFEDKLIQGRSQCATLFGYSETGIFYYSGLRYFICGFVYNDKVIVFGVAEQISMYMVVVSLALWFIGISALTDAANLMSF